MAEHAGLIPIGQAARLLMISEERIRHPHLDQRHRTLRPEDPERHVYQWRANDGLRHLRCHLHPTGDRRSYNRRCIVGSAVMERGTVRRKKPMGVPGAHERSTSTPA